MPCDDCKGVPQPFEGIQPVELGRSEQEFATMLDPWDVEPSTPEPSLLKWVDPSPLLDITLGAAILGLRNEFPHPTTTSASAFSSASVDTTLTYADAGVSAGVSGFAGEIGDFAKLFNGRGSLSV